MKWVKYTTFSAIVTPTNPMTTPIIAVLAAWANPATRVTDIASARDQFSLFPMDNTGSQWLGINACSMLNKRLPVTSVIIYSSWMIHDSLLLFLTVLHLRKYGVGVLNRNLSGLRWKILRQNHFCETHFTVACLHFHHDKVILVFMFDLTLIL